MPKADCGESAEIDVHMTALPSTFQPDLVDGRLTLKHESGDAAKDVVFAREGLPETLEARPSIMKSSLSDATRVGTIYTCSCVRAHGFRIQLLCTMDNSVALISLPLLYCLLFTDSVRSRRNKPSLCLSAAPPAPV